MHLEPRLESVYEVWGSAARRAATFDPAHSPLHGQLGFVVGAPRSGTTWLQQMLFVHPLITTGGESHLFCGGLPDVFANFGNPDPTSHLSSWVAEEELLTAARGFCDAVFLAQRNGTRPDARIVVEKTPNHRLASELQAMLYPDARYVHIIRDGRDSAASQHQLWGGASDEFSSPRRVAEGWAASVRDIRTHIGTLPRYIELRYEDVVAEPAKCLAAIFDHFELPYDDALCAAAASYGKAPVNTPRKAGELHAAQSRDHVLSSRSVARAAGDLLVELGYADTNEVHRLASQRSAATVIADARDAFADARHAVTSVRGRLAERNRRNAMRPTFELSDKLVNAFLARDAAALAGALAKECSLDGKPTTATAAASALVERLGEVTVSNRRHTPDAMELILVMPGTGRRAVLRIDVKDGVATSIDTR